jgi:hypothetical protein
MKSKSIVAIADQTFFLLTDTPSLKRLPIREIFVFESDRLLYVFGIGKDHRNLIKPFAYDLVLIAWLDSEISILAERQICPFQM